MQILIFFNVEAASVWLNGTGYIAKNEGKGNSYLNDNLSFRFNTSAAHGIIMHTLTGNSDIFILELFNGTLVMRINLGGGNSLTRKFILLRKYFVQLPVKTSNKIDIHISTSWHHLQRLAGFDLSVTNCDNMSR